MFKKTKHESYDFDSYSYFLNVHSLEILGSLSEEDDCNQEIKHLNDVISDMEAEMKRNRIMEQFKSISEDPESVKVVQAWKILDRVWSKI